MQSQRDDSLEILIIEDEVTDALLITRALSKRVDDDCLRLFQSGNAGLEYLLQASERVHTRESVLPQLIFLDLKLPGFGGLEIIKQIKTTESLQAIPLIVLTSSREIKDIRQATSAGANSYLIKPNTLKESEVLLNNVLDYWTQFDCCSLALTA